MDTELKSREQFVQQVTDTIDKNHNKYDDSFIFGISGKWGEGKTTFLIKLKTDLESKGFTVLDFNPWKFASDKISFLRSFISLIKSQVKKDRSSRLKDLLLSRDDTLNLYYDISSNKIHWGWFFVLVILELTIPLIYSNLSLEHRNVIKAFKWAIVLFAIPLATFLFGKIIAIQKSSRSISTLDNFENLLKKYLSELAGKKVVIFVDDLDRVTPKVARNVLDNLRTFFDKKDLSFVVAGDHTVLERYLGQDLLPRGSEPEQLEEGRRFMKKIFNVYWRLPLPIDSELQKFLNNLFTEKVDELNKIFKRQEEKDSFKDYLGKYFEKNFRHILRFFETVVFTFGIIDNLKINASNDNQQYFAEMKENPLLVIRILMIQELCTPLFEEVTAKREFGVLSKLEYAVDKQNNDSVNAQIEKYNGILSSSQKSFIIQFLFEKPRFYENSILKVSDIQPFLYLAADAGFGDARGCSPEDFAIILDRGNPEEIKQTLMASGEEKINEGANKFIEKSNTIPDHNQKNNYIKVVLRALVDIPMKYVQISFSERMLQLSLDYIRNLNPQDRVESYIVFWKWLDEFSENDSVTKFNEKFVFINQEDFNFFPQDFKFGKISSSIIMRWFLAYYLQNKRDALIKLNNFVERLGAEIVVEQLAGILDDIVVETLNDADNNLREIRYKLLTIYSDKGKEKLKELVLERIKNLDDNAWSFALGKLGNENSPWAKDEMEQQIINRLNPLSEHIQLVPILRFSIGKIENLINELWSSIIKNYTNELLDYLSQIIDDYSFHPIAPNNRNAITIFNKLAEKIKNIEDSQKANWLKYLEKGKWIWHNINKINDKKISAIESTNEQAMQALNTVSNSWLKSDG